MSTDKTTVIQEVQKNDTLSTIFVDGAIIHSRKDGMYFIRFTASHPDAIREQVRLMINDIHLHTVINVMCEISGYYPTKPVKEQKLNEK